MVACRHAAGFRFDLLRSLAVSFFNNLEEVKILSMQLDDAKVSLRWIDGL